MADPIREQPLEDRHAHLEMLYVQQYFEGKGYTLESVNQLPAEQAKTLWREAMLFASGRLADTESRSQMLLDLEGKARRL